MGTEPGLPRSIDYPVPLAETLGAFLGFEHLEVGEELARARFEVSNRHKQPFGLVHGGVLAALAEGLASEATAMTVGPEGFAAQGMAQNLSFLRPVLAGTVHAEARRRHRGRTTWVWDVEITDDEGRLCAVSRLTIAVRPMTDEVRAKLGLA